MYLFVYGSLTSAKSRAQTLTYSTVVRETVTLSGYARKINALYTDGFLYMNIVPRENASICGALLEIDPRDLQALTRREEGYTLTDITTHITEDFSEQIFAYTQPDNTYPEAQIPQSYIDTCLSYVPESERDTWLKETIIQNNILNDTKNPLYEFPE